ncbi:hypothetical protein [Paenibacillus kobensis]|nr:hypothetical protein [Paenibacillus kobensis]
MTMVIGTAYVITANPRERVRIRLSGHDEALKVGIPLRTASIV